MIDQPAATSPAIRIRYPNGRVVAVPPGTSILEASRLAGVPHASVCGGNSRCSTCRVRVVGRGSLPEPVSPEADLLSRLALPANVRLGCQLRPAGDVAVVPLLPADATAQDGSLRPSYMTGTEREVAVAFADLRGFTTMAERMLPFDVVFVLNQYFSAMDAAITAAGGAVSQFYGDGIMALFGLESSAEVACRQAIAAAAGMIEGLAGLNAYLCEELQQPLRMGIGLHVGSAVVGAMGKGRSTAIAAIGDVVNTASRLEGLTKEHDAVLVGSLDLVRRAGLEPPAERIRTTDIRGRAGVLAIVVVPDAAGVAALAAACQPPPASG